MSNARVLVVDDEPVLAGMVVNYLLRAGYDARSVGDGLLAVEQARAWAPDVVVLDLGLPGMDGVEVARTLRTFTDAYIIMLTARDDEVDRLIGLSVGADDYVTKPFSARELVARVGVMLRRPRTGSNPAPSQSRLLVGDLAIDPATREVTVSGELVDLTRTEFDLLMTLATNPRVVLSRRRLIDEIWGGDWVGDDRLVDVHVAHLRKKLRDDPASPRWISTVRGVGYRMERG